MDGFLSWAWEGEKVVAYMFLIGNGVILGERER
jgi:hypothetical protein